MKSFVRSNSPVAGAAALATVALLGGSSILQAQKPVRAQKKVAAKVADVPYRASQFSGVEVRSVPAPATKPAGPGAAWVYRDPKAPRTPTSTTRRVGRGGTKVYGVGRGTTPLGGTVIYLDPDSLPRSQAKTGANGELMLRCTQDAQLHSLAKHQAHARQTAGDKSASQRR